MAISFKKEVILEAIEEILAEKTIIASKAKKMQQQQDVNSDPSIPSAVKPAVKKALDQATDGEEIEVPTNEDHHENPNDESDMAKVQLHNTAKYCIELLKMIQDGQQLDAWVQSKLTVAFEHIDTVKHYLEGEEYLASTEAPSEEEPLMEDEDVYDTDIDDKQPSKKDLKAAEKETGGKRTHFTPEAQKMHDVIKIKVGKIEKKIEDKQDYKLDLAALKQYISKPEVRKALGSNHIKGMVSSIIGETLTEGVSCCGRCGRVHESSQECKKPYISKDSPNHCSKKK